MTRHLFAISILVLAALAGCSDIASARLQTIAPRLAMTGPLVLPQREQLYQRHPSVAFGDGVYLLAWQEGYHGLGGGSDILAIRIDPAGRLLDEQPIVVCDHAGVQTDPAVAYVNGKFLIAWSDFRNGKDFDLYARLVDAKGVASDEFLVSGGAGGQASPAAASDGQATFLLAWQDFRSGSYYAIYTTRVTADGRMLDPDGVLAMPRGEEPSLTFADGDFVVAQKWYAARIGADGRPKTESTQLWQTKTVLFATAASAWGKPLVFINTEPHPDPWGWGGNGAIIGLTVDAQGQSPEKEAYFEKNSLRSMSSLEADGRVVNCIDAARWRGRPGWPMGRPGGFKGPEDGTWPSGRIAAAHNGRSLLVVWNRAHWDNHLLNNRDLCLARVAPGWDRIDPANLAIVDGPTEEIEPVLSAGPEGEALLAYEKVNAEGGVLIEFRRIHEDADTAPPQVEYTLALADGRMAVGFDEPVDPAGVKADAFAIEGVEVKSAELDGDPRLGGRRVVLTTGPQQAGKTYTLRITGLADRSPSANATAGQAVTYLQKPGRASASGYVEQWNLVGPFPNDWSVDFVRPAVRPTPGQAVATPSLDALRAMHRKQIGEKAWKDRGLDAKFDDQFGGDLQWKAVESAGGVVLPISRDLGELEDASAYAHVWVFSDQAQRATLRVDTSDGNRVWFNGNLLYVDRTRGDDLRAYGAYANKRQVTLARGWNSLLVEVENRFGRWSLSAQFTDDQGLPLRDLTYTVEAPAGP